MKSLKPAIWGSALACGLALLTPAAHAGLIGTTVDITTGSGFLQGGSCSGLTVDTNVECRILDFIPVDIEDDVIDVDIRDSSIVFEFLDILNSGAGYAWTVFPEFFDVVIDGLTWVNDPSAVIESITVTQELFGLVATNGFIGATLTGPNQITLNFGMLGLVNCGTVLCARLTVDITPAHGVPEPATLALLGLGLAGLGAVRRRRA